MDNQVDLRQELEFLENFISVSEKQLNSLARGLEDYTRALSVLQDQNVGTSTDTLLSVGGGVFVRGSVKPDADTLVSIGSEIFIEENREKSTERLKNLIEEIRKSFEGLNNQRAEALRRYELIVSAINQQQSEKNSDVT
ncbi:MAG: prefoldin subunit alpha [Candidatus Thermoplasmatota archaeon]|jgi:prefoldin alpha subunit|nr:prefoldin subunit alpha [Candidatus Thermoplasmatota archaeon]